LKVRPARKGDFETIVEMSLAGPPYNKAGLRNFETYLELIRSVGGEILVAEEEGEIIGEAELIPQSDLSVAGPHVFLQNLSSVNGDRSIRRELLRACKKLSRSWGFSFLDHIPSSLEDLEDLKLLGFTTTRAKQVLLRTKPKRIANLAKVIEEVPQKYPTNLALLSGEIRPGKLAWSLAFFEYPLIQTKAIKVRVGRFEFVSLFFEIGKSLHLSFYGVPASGPGEIFNALGATLTIANNLKARDLKTLSWERYLCPFESAEFEVIKQVPLLRLRVD